ncbi:thioredoxin family protein [Pyrococcus yayanosii]|uniref:Glutaredoxin domain protein n=1 Tax=Pyrococcus yayanosii (strain CH1 / JCM 16557) TaxID=529709 RepID=F8AJ92_PYRYC|nr:thioredoxin family protein [Pyrococcus yayanosii]AEH24533.1 Glutaredoxin domain protein [Pyrococcus yayanosii CH1]
MKELSILLIIILAVAALGCLGETSTPTTSPPKLQLDKSKFHFYLYGMATCPHCQNMKRELPKFFGEDSLTYYELINNEHNTKIFMEFSKELGVRGVPLIGVFYDGKLYAIIEGEIDPSKIPEIVKEAMDREGIIVLSSRAYLIPFNETDIVQKLTELFLSGQASQ